MHGLKRKVTDGSYSGFRHYFPKRSVEMSPSVGLAKVPLCLLIGCSTLFGYILADPVISPRMFFITSGIFVLATGAATLNSLQEYHSDGEFERTKNRPLPMGFILPCQAGAQALFLLFIGLVLIFITTQTISLVLPSVFAVILYNGVYTPLKKKTVLAIIPGAICGAFPPYIGWLGGGGKPDSYAAALLIALFVLWQIPHYWLVLLTFKEDYERSHLPNLLKQFRENSLKRLLVTWICALILVMLMFLTLPVVLAWYIRLLIILNGSLLLIVFVYITAIRKSSNFRFLFIMLNCALFLHMFILSLGRILA